MNFEDAYRVLPQVVTHADIMTYVKTLMLVAQCDGMDPKEMQNLVARAESMGASDEVVDFINAGAVSESLDQLLSIFSGQVTWSRLLYRDAYELVHVDGMVSDPERKVLADLADKLEISDGIRTLTERYVMLSREMAGLSDALFVD
jgi:uncharacterized membrane protein YebE (DUF533 family)